MMCCDTHPTLSADISCEAYESEVDQILKDANAKVRKLAEARFESCSNSDHKFLIFFDV